MFKIVRKNTFHSIQQELDKAEEELKKLIGENEKLAEEVKKLHDLFNNASENSVRIDISPDIKSVTPSIKYNPEIFEKLVELGYLDDTKQNHTFAIQLALIVVAHDAMAQILDTYQAPIDNSD